MEGGLNERLNGLPSSEPLLSGIQAYDQVPHVQSLFVSGTSVQSAQMILTLKRGQKGWRRLFSETHCDEVLSLGSLLRFMYFILRQ